MGCYNLKKGGLKSTLSCYITEHYKIQSYALRNCFAIILFGLLLY